MSHEVVKGTERNNVRRTLSLPRLKDSHILVVKKKSKTCCSIAECDDVRVYVANKGPRLN